MDGWAEVAKQWRCCTVAGWQYHAMLGWHYGLAMHQIQSEHRIAHSLTIMTPATIEL
jgi:hypothetical protein